MLYWKLPCANRFECSQTFYRRMSKTFSSLQDLATLLPDDARNKDEHIIEKKKGYDGSQQRIDLRLDKKGRGGKMVTVLSGFQSNPKELDLLCQTFKKLCGTGGTVRDNLIEIQGDHRKKLEQSLIERGYKTRMIG
ncbi:MAG: translation initiation factor [Bacteroidetes bacterium]|nr:translation initiation factor [bacterium]NBP63135.1 translation initiation factor [Bacteroidota bacterium]